MMKMPPVMNSWPIANDTFDHNGNGYSDNDHNNNLRPKV